MASEGTTEISRPKALLISSLACDASHLASVRRGLHVERAVEELLAHLHAYGQPLSHFSESTA